MLPALRYRATDPTETTSGNVHDSFTAATPAEQGTNANRRVGQSWDSGADPQEVTGATVKLERFGVMDGLMRLSIYPHTGTFGTSSEWTGNPLVSSTFYAMDAVSVTATTYFFPLSGWTPVANTDYVAVLEFFDHILDNSHRVAVKTDTAGDATHEGNLATQADSTGSITPLSTSDMEFAVYYADAGGGGGGDDDFILRLRDGTYRRRMGWGVGVLLVLMTACVSPSAPHADDPCYELKAWGVETTQPVVVAPGLPIRVLTADMQWSTPDSLTWELREECA